jgi:hypothetical protein
VPIYLGGEIYGGLIIQHGDLEIRHVELELLKSFADLFVSGDRNELLRTRAEDEAVVHRTEPYCPRSARCHYTNAIFSQSNR